jgi:hypothetical protein
MKMACSVGVGEKNENFQAVRAVFIANVVIFEKRALGSFFMKN